MKRRIACAQLAARDLGDAAAALSDALAAVAEAGAAGADLCVLPEGTYPGYVVGSAAAARAALAASPDAEAAIGAAARDTEIEVVAGLVRDTPDGLMNAAVHFGSDGRVRNRAAKRFLWHFDRGWFTAGGESEPVDGIGMLVCADGRRPEIAGALAHRGAGLLVNATAWVVSQPPPAGTNAQAEFLWRVRALETGCAAAAATKVGTEAGVAIYGGRSQIVAPDGTVVALASTDAAEVLVADIEVPEAPVPPAPPVRVPATPEPRVAGSTSPRGALGIAHLAVVTTAGLLGALEHHGCDLVVGPDGVVRGDLASVEIRDAEMLAPGPARAAAATGAVVVVWLARSVPTPYVEEVARARAAENRVFVAVWRAVADGGPFVVHPSGAVIARAPVGEDFAVAASIVPAEAAVKALTPGTDAFAPLP
jgi:predicted amidohydrolase